MNDKHIVVTTVTSILKVSGKTSSFDRALKPSGLLSFVSVNWVVLSAMYGT